MNCLQWRLSLSLYAGKQLPPCLLPSPALSSDSEEDQELTALLHQKVVKVSVCVCVCVGVCISLFELCLKVKKEICWDEEEEKLRKKSQLKKVVRADYSSSDAESETSDSEGTRRPIRPRRRRRRRRKQWKKGCGWVYLDGGDVSETLYETEYPSECDPSQVQSEPEEVGWSTPPPRLELPRVAYSTPRAPKHLRRHSAGFTDEAIIELGKRLSAPIAELGKRLAAPITEMGKTLSDPVAELDKTLPVPTAKRDPIAEEDKMLPVPIANQDTPRTDEGSDFDSGGFVSGYDSASEYLSGPGECLQQRDPNSDSDNLEYIGSPNFPLVGTGPGSPELLPPPLPLSPSRFDENFPVISENHPQGTDRGGNGRNLQDLNKCASPKTDERSCDGPRDPHVTSPTGNTYTNITYVTYCTGGTSHSSCSTCYMPQCYHSSHHHPHRYPYCHHPPPSHFSSAPSTTTCNYCPLEAVVNRASPDNIHKLVDPDSVQILVNPEIFRNLVDFETVRKAVDPESVPYTVNPEAVNTQAKKRKLDIEQSDPLPNGTEPPPKKQCY